VSIAEADSSLTREQQLEARLARMQVELAATNAQLATASGRLADVINERDNLRRAYRQLMEQFELLRRRIVVLADKRHVFFEYQPKHTTAAVCEMFRGFSGYIQADAHAIYDALFRGEAVDDAKDAPLEVACWSHARRRFWEAAVSGFAVGREGLLRIRKLFQIDAGFNDLSPAARTQKRRRLLAPLLDEFFEWARAQDDPTSRDRGLVNKALA
jgi:hypothetical protein